MVKAALLLLLRGDCPCMPASSFQEFLDCKAIRLSANWICFVSQQKLVCGANILIGTFKSSESVFLEDISFSKVADSVRIVNAV